MIRYLYKLYKKIFKSWSKVVLYLGVLLTIYFIYVYSHKDTYEPFQAENNIVWLNGVNTPPILSENASKEKNAFCLLTRKPDDIWLQFLNTFLDTYDVYVVIDDNTVDISVHSIKYPKLYFIKIDNDICKQAGYFDSSYIIKKEVIAWDKALYYFGSLDKSYRHVWFSEDDVYLRSVDITKNIDGADNKSDLLCKEKTINTSGEVESWMHWIKAKEHFDIPWSGSLQCICRMSNKMLSAIDDFVKKNGRLNFIEILFTNIADKNGMIITNPPQFRGMEYHSEHLQNIINMALDPEVIYHAVKNTKEHEDLRNK
jgi:hypothetical protein